MSATDIRVYPRHARAAGHGGTLCAPGIRAWCERYGLDLRAFCEHGLPVDVVEAVPDDFAQRAAALARQEAEETQHDA